MKKEKDRVYLLRGGRSPLTYSLPSVDKPKSRLLHFDGKRNRAMRYARNQKSPFIDEQDDHVVLEAIVFTDGQLVVPPTNPELIEFLRIHPLNGQTFELFDPEALAEQREKEEDLKADAAIKVRELSVEEMATVLRDMTDLRGIEDLSAAEIRWEAKRFANNYPQEFLEYFEGTDGADEEGILDEAVRAIEDRYVTVRKGGKIHYNTKENKSQMLIVPHGVSAEKALSDWLISNEGNEFYEFLRTEFEPKED